MKTMYLDLMAASVLAMDHLRPEHMLSGPRTSVPAVMPEDVLAPALADCALVVDLARQVALGRDMLPELLDVLARNALIQAIITLAARDRTFLVVHHASVEVSASLRALDVESLADEAGAPVHDTVYGWRFDQLVPGPVTQAVREELAR